MGPLVRVVDAGLGADAQVRLVVSGVSDAAKLRSVWASSGATLELRGERVHATTTVQALARAAGRALARPEAQDLDTVLRAAVHAWSAPAPALSLPAGTLDLGARPALLGVVNVTPDSFSDGGLLYPDAHPDAALAHAQQMLDEGADIIDVGGESTRPGATPVDADEELRRVLPVVEGLAARGALVSIDTRKASVARAALDAGAQIVNDVSGGRDEALLEAVADSGAAYVLMHTRGTPQDMQSQTDYADVVADVYEYLAQGLARCADAGIAHDKVVVDPGIGFAKTAEQNLVLLRALRQFRGLGRPVMVGASRKSFLGTVLDGAGVDERLEASLACVALATAAGAGALRVHDAEASQRAARTARAITTGALDWPPVAGTVQ